MRFVLAATLLFAQPITVPKEFSPATCESAEQRAALLAANAEEPPFIAAIRERSAEQERRMDVLIERLGTARQAHQRAEVPCSPSAYSTRPDSRLR